MDTDNVLRIFCSVDDFCQDLSAHGVRLLPKERKRNRAMRMSTSEVMTILILFHLSHYRELKHFYLHEICETLRAEFPHPVSYNRFVELERAAGLPLLLYAFVHRGAVTGLSFVDSTVLAVCNNRRIYSHKVFSGIAKRGKTSMGWFYGLKLHLVVNDRGEILAFTLTPGNVDDRNPEVIRVLTRELFGLLFGDRGYVSQKLFRDLFERGIKLVTRIKRNMENLPMDLTEKLLLRKRALIESVNETLKHVCQIEHTRHRSVANFFVNLLAGLIGYGFLEKKPSLDLPIRPEQFGQNVKQLVFC